MDHRGLVRGVLDPLSHPLLLDIVDNLLLDHPRNILGLVLHSIEVLDSLFDGYNLLSCHLIVLGDDLLDRDLFHSLDLVVLNSAFLIWDVLNPALGWEVLDYGLFVDSRRNGCGAH